MRCETNFLVSSRSLYGQTYSVSNEVETDESQ